MIQCLDHPNTPDMCAVVMKGCGASNVADEKRNSLAFLHFIITKAVDNNNFSMSTNKLVRNPIN